MSRLLRIVGRRNETKLHDTIEIYAIVKSGCQLGRVLKTLEDKGYTWFQIDNLAETLEGNEDVFLAVKH